MSFRFKRTHTSKHYLHFVQICASWALKPYYIYLVRFYSIVTKCISNSLLPQDSIQNKISNLFLFCWKSTADMFLLSIFRMKMYAINLELLYIILLNKIFHFSVTRTPSCAAVSIHSNVVSATISFDIPMIILVMFVRHKTCPNIS